MPDFSVGDRTIIALAALAVTGIPFLTIMGLSAAATVLLAVLVAISLVPAVLALFGNRLRPRPRSTTSAPTVPLDAGFYFNH
ncbi:MMPL family transporter [Streptacidiphilus anmyonensis]|uniref:MMPL family transporter n=1 Tax=Streptacidiphilus anmyonensis TaxID=405782 RepID=UPI0005A69C56|nr:MMPL family transporter [Streptacidiphilus anmyonensis]